MNIAFVTAEYPPKNIGGAGISSKLIVEELRKKGINVDVYALTGTEKSCIKTNTNHYEIPNANQFSVPPEIGGNLSVLKYLPDLSKYDITHCYNTGHCPATILKSDPPTVATINNHMWVSIDPVQYLKEGGTAYNWKRMYNYSKTSGYSYQNRIIRSLVERFAKSLIKRAGHLTVQTNGMKSVARNCGYQNQPISVVPNIVDPGFFNKSTSPDCTVNDKSTMIFLGRLTNNKGIMDALNAFIELPAVIHRDWEFKIYGKGPVKGKVQQVINDSPEYVDVELDYVPYSELTSVYSQADVLIHSSKYTEPFSRTWLEAMASGTAIICSKNPSSKCVLSNVAELYDPFDSDDLKKSLINVLKHADIQDMADQGKEIVKKYHPNNVVDKYVDVYENTIECSVE